MDGWPEPEIDYPCRWTYKLVGPSEPALRGAVGSVVAGREHAIDLSRVSSGGKYVSLKVDVLVHDHDERRGLAEALKAHTAVLFVL